MSKKPQVLNEGLKGAKAPIIPLPKPSTGNVGSKPPVITTPPKQKS